MGKRMSGLMALVDKTKTYSVDEAIALVKKTSAVKFDASVEAHVRLGIDTGKSEQNIRATVVMPAGIGKTKTVAAFVGPNDEKAAQAAGADFVYSDEDIKKIKDTGKIEFEVAIATPEMMPKLAMVAKVLGPKGLMPNPKTETVGPDVKKMIEELKKGKATFKNDDGGNVHQMIGKISFDDAKLKDNFTAFMDALKKVKPQGLKGNFIEAIYLTSSMGPSVKVAIE